MIQACSAFAPSMLIERNPVSGPGTYGKNWKVMGEGRVRKDCGYRVLFT